MRNSRGDKITLEEEGKAVWLVVEWRNKKRGEGGGWWESKRSNERAAEREIRREEVMNALKKMKRSKGAGLDCIAVKNLVVLAWWIGC